ncbi:MAG: hypothetical protein L3J00_02945 [Thiomicrorhabdus sp.]|nr:hypothetical protein [Thiomicrorhabdus sp.]
MKNVKLMLILAAMFGASSVAIAAENGSASDAGALMTTLDANQDGVVSKDEAAVSKEVSAQWDLLDLDKDGFLTAKELSLVDLSAS